MKHIILGLVSLCVVVISKAQTADEVITKYIAALGGGEKIAALETLKMVGNLDAGGTAVEINITVANKKGYRLDIIVPNFDAAFQIYTPVKAWSYFPFRGQTEYSELSEAEMKEGQSYLDVHGILFKYKEKGYTAELVGKTKYEGVDVYEIKMTSPAGKVTRFLIDATTYYKLATISVNKDGTESSTVYSNYKKTAEGYLFPFSQSNASGTVDFSSIEVNKPVDESIFKP